MSSTPLPTLLVTQRLRDLQRVNAAFSGLAGAAMAVSNDWLSSQVDLPRPFVLALGIGLVGWAVLLLVVARLPSASLRRASSVVALGDLSWVMATIALIAFRHPTATGTVLATAAAIVVATFAAFGLALANGVVR